MVSRAHKFSAALMKVLEMGCFTWEKGATGHKARARKTNSESSQEQVAFVAAVAAAARHKPFV